MAAMQPTADQINDLLPQTQCTRCGYPDCQGYAQAIAAGEADINRCAPGGTEGVVRLAQLTGRAVQPLDAAYGFEGPRTVVWIDEAWCIGCTLCIKACPVDCIVGAPKQMHTVIEADCTGCELCVPACPVDCIEVQAVTGDRTGWAAWTAEQADAARVAYAARNRRRARADAEQAEALEAKARHKLEHLEVLTHAADPTRPADPAALARKRDIIEAALARARARREGGG